MICHSVEVGRAFVDEELAVEMRRLWKYINELGSYPLDPAIEPPLALKTLKELGMVNLCPITKISWQSTEMGRICQLERLIVVQ